MDKAFCNILCLLISCKILTYPSQREPATKNIFFHEKGMRVVDSLGKEPLPAAT